MAAAAIADEKTLSALDPAPCARALALIRAAQRVAGRDALCEGTELLDSKTYLLRVRKEIYF